MAEITGTDGDEFLTGTDENDTIDGLGGIDGISGRDGNDTIYGGEGGDGASGDEGNDSIDGGGGDDNLGGWYGDDSLWEVSGLVALVVGETIADDVALAEIDARYRDGFADWRWLEG